MTLPIRKLVRYSDETYIEGGKPAERPWIMVAVATVIQNPWAGQGFVEDLRTEIKASAVPLGQLLSGGDGEGILAMTFSVNGPIRDPSFSVNPLSILAPGFLRKIFSGQQGEVSESFVERLNRERGQ